MCALPVQGMEGKAHAVDDAWLQLQDRAPGAVTVTNVAKYASSLAVCGYPDQALAVLRSFLVSSEPYEANRSSPSIQPPSFPRETADSPFNSFEHRGARNEGGASSWPPSQASLDGEAGCTEGLVAEMDSTVQYSERQPEVSKRRKMGIVLPELQEDFSENRALWVAFYHIRRSAERWGLASKSVLRLMREVRALYP